MLSSADVDHMLRRVSADCRRVSTAAPSNTGVAMTVAALEAYSRLFKMMWDAPSVPAGGVVQAGVAVVHVAHEVIFAAAPGQDVLPGLKDTIAKFVEGYGLVDLVRGELSPADFVLPDACPEGRGKVLVACGLIMENGMYHGAVKSGGCFREAMRTSTIHPSILVLIAATAYLSKSEASGRAFGSNPYVRALSLYSCAETSAAELAASAVGMELLHPYIAAILDRRLIADFPDDTPHLAGARLRARERECIRWLPRPVLRAVLGLPPRELVCDGCGETVTYRLACECLAFKCCSSACFAAHWRRHRSACRAARAAAAGPET